MSSVELAKFLNVALDVQAPPYEGVHVSDGVVAATDGVMLVAARFNKMFFGDEGSLSPKAAKIIAAMAEETHIGSVSLGKADGNRITVTAQSRRYDETAGGDVAGEFQTVVLPEFYCPRVPVKRMLATLTDEARGWVQIVENPRLTNIKEWSTKEYVALMNNPREGYELFRLKDMDDAHWYSVSQLRRGLRLFGAKAHLSVRRNAKGWLVFEDRFGQTFALTPFVKHQ